MLLLRPSASGTITVRPAGNIVAIPYSSGMLLLPTPRRLDEGQRYTGRNPLFIGNAFATRCTSPPCPRPARTCRNPLFIGNAFATPIDDPEMRKRLVRFWKSQSPIHRECFCYYEPFADERALEQIGRNPLFIGNAFATTSPKLGSVNRSQVAIPYSSGMLLLPYTLLWANRAARIGVGRNPLFIGNAFATRQNCAEPTSWQQKGRNPLFIGNAFATPSTPPSLRRWCPDGRNPLFIGNAFATCGQYDVGHRRPIGLVSQSPIHRECFCYVFIVYDENLPG